MGLSISISNHKLIIATYNTAETIKRKVEQIDGVDKPAIKPVCPQPRGYPGQVLSDDTVINSQPWSEIKKEEMETYKEVSDSNIECGIY